MAADDRPSASLPARNDISPSTRIHPANDRALNMAVPAGHDEIVLMNATAHALTLHERGMLAEAEKVYAAILQASPDHFDALHLLGVLRQQQGDSAEAERLIGAALKLVPRSVEALCNFGAVLNALKRPDEALAAFDQALATFDRTLAIKPHDLEALISRGNALMLLNEPAQALICFDKALAQEPDHAVALGNRGL